MIKLFRFLFRIPKPKIDRDEALIIAKEFFVKEGVRIVRPYIIEESYTWLVWANKDMKPSTWARINNQDGKIMDSGTPIL